MSNNKRMSSTEVMSMLKEGYAKDPVYAERIAHNENSRRESAELTKQRIANGTASAMELLRSGFQKTIDDEAEAKAKAKATKEREDAEAQAAAQNDKARADEQAKQKASLQESKLQEINKLIAEVEALNN